MANEYDEYAAGRKEQFLAGLSLPHRFVEKPAMRRILPNLTSKLALMVGCGTGEETELLIDAGARHLVGIDSSAVSIDLATQAYEKLCRSDVSSLGQSEQGDRSSLRVEFKIADMHALPFQDSTFDFVYSSLALHYSSDPGGLYREMFRVLRPGGIFQFSVGHPMRWASQRLLYDSATVKILGYSEDSSPVRTYGSYSKFEKYAEKFPTGESLEFWVGPPSMHFELLRQVGFVVQEFIETKAVDECRSVDSDYYERFSNFPQYTIFQCEKTA